MTEIFWIGVGSFLGIFGFLTWHLSPGARIKRALRKASRWPIAELPENTHGRIVGTTRAVGETLTSPLTGRACVYYIVTVLEGDGKAKMPILREEKGVPFIVEDDTGRALIDPRDCQILLDFDRETESGHGDNATPAEEALLARHGQDSEGWLLNKVLLYRESVIEIGEAVAVLGSGIREPDPDAEPSAAYRGAPATRLRLTSSARFPLVISDHRTTTTE